MKTASRGALTTPARPRRLSRAARAAVALTTLGIAAGIPVAAAGASTSHTESLLTKGMKFYKGKTITLVSPDSPGGGFDQWARLLQPALATYLHATVNVENIPAGNTVAGQDTVAKATPNGLTVGWLNAGPDIEDEILNIPALNFNPLREAFLGATAPGQTAIVTLNSSACSQYSNFGAVLNATSANKISEALQTTGTGTFFMLMVNAAFGIQFSPRTGYQSTNAQVQGFTRGDACLSEMPAATADPLVKGGKATAVALSVPLQPVSAIKPDFANVPSIAQLAKTYASHIKSQAQRNAYAALTQVNNSTRVFFTAGTVPAAQVAALRAAFQWAMLKDGTLRSNAIAEGNPVGYTPGPTAKQSFQTFYSTAKREIGVLQSVIG